MVTSQEILSSCDPLMCFWYSSWQTKNVCACYCNHVDVVAGDFNFDLTTACLEYGRGFHFWQSAPGLNIAPMAGTHVQPSHYPPLKWNKNRHPSHWKKCQYWNSKREGRKSCWNLGKTLAVFLWDDLVQDQWSKGHSGHSASKRPS